MAMTMTTTTTTTTTMTMTMATTTMMMEACHEFRRNGLDFAPLGLTQLMQAAGQLLRLVLSMALLVSRAA